VRGAKATDLDVGFSMKPVKGCVSRILLKWAITFILSPFIFYVPGLILADFIGVENFEAVTSWESKLTVQTCIFIDRHCTRGTISAAVHYVLPGFVADSMAEDEETCAILGD